MTYLGEEVVDQKDTPFSDYGVEEWVLYFIERYGQIDGGHHKQWVLDQISRILHRTPIIITLAKWSDGTEEYRVSTSVFGSFDYDQWVLKMCGEYDEENLEFEYDYDTGIAP